ncbi:diguanylate cyclase [Sulfurimonas sp.]|uniref:sensor domain-containing diguanylate cyclase n=1 Tax=Sulfurimonas sp. TaxID=2022749 RepID=UPI002B4794F5|nr:diguanylate cyclase [Sulfurimonas sp.]
MKSFNIQFENEKSLNFFVESNKIVDYENILIQVFTGIIDEKHSLKISYLLKKMLPHSHIIGTTTSGEIYKHKIHNKTTLISISVFDSTTVKSKFYKLDGSFRISNIKDDLIMDNTKVLIIFSDGLKSDAERLLKKISLLKPEIIIAGGRAGDNLEFKKTYIFDEQTQSDDACVIASLSSDDLIVNNEYLLNWTPIGKDMIVTKVDGNILYELDNTPVVEIYKKYLGRDIVDDLLFSSLDFPLIIKRDKLLIARGAVAKTEDNALVFAGNFEQGDVVRFSIGNMEDVINDTAKYFSYYNQMPAESIFVYSCSARKFLMGDKLEDEMNILESLAPTVGFFTYGEYFHSSNIAEILNITTTFLTLSETSKIKKRTLNNVPTQKYDVVKKALTHLIKVTTKELEHTSTYDLLTEVHNRAEYIKRIGLKLKSASRYKEKFGIILVDIDYFKLVNDNYGHAVGDSVLKKFASILSKNVREDDFVARWGGEEFVIIANHVSVKDLERLTKKLQKVIAKTSFTPVPKLTASFGLSIYIEGDGEETLFRRVDNAMYAAKKDGRNTYMIG